MAVKGAVVDYRNWRKTPSSISSDIEESEIKEGLSIKEEIDLPNKKLESFKKEFENQEFGSSQIKELERKNLLDFILESELLKGSGANGLESGNAGLKSGAKKTSGDQSGIRE